MIIWWLKGGSMEYRGNILKINTSIEKSEEVKLY